MTPVERDTSIRRAMQVLACLSGPHAQDVGGLGVNRIAELIGQDKSQVSRSLAVLAEYGMVDRDPATLAYRLGWRIFAMAQVAGDRHLLALAAARLPALVDELGESVYLSVLQGREALTLLAVPSTHEVRAVAWTGRTVPAPSTSVGRALLARRPDAAVRALFEGAPEVDVDALLARLAEVREHGYAVVDQEFEPGLVAVAAPVVDARGTVIAALNVSGPSYRFGPHVDAAIKIIVAAAADLSAMLRAP